MWIQYSAWRECEIHVLLCETFWIKKYIFYPGWAEYADMKPTDVEGWYISLNLTNWHACHTSIK